jgi:hypothetical protein
VKVGLHCSTNCAIRKLIPPKNERTLAGQLMEGRCDRGDDRIELLGAPCSPSAQRIPLGANPNVPNTGDTYEED